MFLLKCVPCGVAPCEPVPFHPTQCESPNVFGFIPFAFGSKLYSQAGKKYKAVVVQHIPE